MAHAPVDGAIAEQARKTLGLVTMSDLHALGVTRRQRRTLVDHGVLVRISATVFRHAAWPPAWRQAVLAAVLSRGAGAVASHMAAAAHWAFEGVPPGAIEVAVPHERRPGPGPGRLHRTRTLGPADVGEAGGIPVTTPSRTLIDVAPRLGADHLERILDAAERDGLVWRPHLRWRLADLRRRGRPGPPQVAALLDRTEGRPLGESWLEAEAIRVLTAAGLPLPRCQVTLRPGGGGVARVDLAWEDERLIVELDGHGGHATRRQRQADAERASRLALAGWLVVRFTYEDVTERPAYVVTTIRRHLRIRGAA